ncbi:MAG: protein kinase [Planctomycetota bacterium]
MSGSSQSLSKRDRALAELVRVRGWANDASIEKAVAEASRSEGAPDLGSVLVASGIITPVQLQTLSDAIEGKSSRSRAGTRPPSRAPSSASDKTIAASDPGVTVKAPSGVRKPPDQIGPYRVLRELGRGGMGVVYRALDPELRREVALKVMIAGAQAAEADVERFRREAAVVAKMGRHPHLVQIHDIGRDGDRLYFTMDFVEGISAKQRVEQDGAFPPREAARIGAEIAGALAFAHKAGVLHRDVKPHNVLLDREGKAFLGDFGLAKDLTANAGLTESGSAFGTPAYMPPEQAGGHASHATPLSDVYSLGATLFELLTGRAPFIGETGMDIIRQVLEHDPPSLRSLKEGIHRDLEIICLKALRKEPPKRYASAAELEADLRRFLNGEPIHARPAGRLEKLVIKLKRHRAVVGVATAGFLLAGGIAVGATWRLKSKERQAENQKADLERREKETTPLLLEGKSLVDRADDAGRSGGWKDRAEYARRAVETLQKARAALPESEDVCFELGRALRRAGREEEALKVLEQAVAINAKDPRAWFEHGSICQERLSRSRGTLMRLAMNAVQNEVGFVVSGFRGNVIAWIGGTGTPEDETRLRSTAIADFRKVVETGAVPFCAAYGEGMLLFYDSKHEQALEKIDASLAINPYFVDAIEARAEILEWWKQDITAGLAERKKLCDQQPSNPRFALEYALSLRATGKRKEALVLARKAAERVEGNPAIALRASQVALQCGDEKLAAKLAEDVLASGDATVNRGEAARMIVDARMSIGDEKSAEEEIAKYRGVLDPDWESAYMAEVHLARGDVPATLSSLRAVKTGTGAYQAMTPFATYFEQSAGNLARAELLAKQAEDYGMSKAYRMLRGLVAMDRGELQKAVVDFEAVKVELPTLNANLSNLAAAKFLLRDYAGAIDTLEESVLATPLAKAQKEQAKKSFGVLRGKLDTAKEPKDAAKVVEEIVGLLTLAGMQTQDKATQGAIREGMRGLLRVLQQFYADLEMWKESGLAADRYLKISRNGAMLYRVAQVRARSGDLTGALAAIEEAQALGFDEGARLDGDSAFEKARGLPEWAGVRGKCR